MIKKLKLLLSIGLIIPMCASVMGQEISGKILDEDGDSLIGASVVEFNTSNGTTTGIDGSYSFTVSSIPTQLEVSFVGFEGQTISVSSAGDQGITVLIEEALFGEEIVVSASRKPEKITEAPSSISVIGSREINAAVQSNPSLLLQKTPGIQLAQMGADRFSIALRGQSATFLSGTFVMLDNRPLSSLSEQTYFYLDNPFPKLDIDKVEVIRGPGSALYGGNVTSGVVHYISKSPFTSQGTTVEVTGGNQSTYQFAARHAGVSGSGKLGYKFNVFYKRGDEWQYDPNDELDREQLGRVRFQSIDPDGNTIFELPEKTTSDGFNYFEPQQFVEYYGVSSTLEYVVSDDLTISTNLGYSKSDASFWTTNGFGIRRPDNFYGQIKLTGTKTFFSTSYSTQAQSFDNSNVESLINVGSTATGSPATAQSKENIDFQIQRQLITNDDFELVIGGDARIGLTDSQEALFARFEDDNDIEIFGAYVQGDYAISEKLSLTGALRYDNFAPLEENKISPRIATVFKPNASTALRASYNKAFAGPGSIQQYIDLVLGPVRQGGGATGPPIGFQRNVGSSVPLTFDSSPITFAGTARGLGESGTDRLISHQAAIDALISQFPSLAGLLNGLSTTNTSTPRTVAINNGGAIIGEAPVQNNSKLELTDQTTYEVGITTTIKGKLRVSLDIYYNDIKNAASVSTPFTRLVTSGGLANEVMATINGLTTLSAADQAIVMDSLLAIFPDSDESMIGAIQSEQVRASVANGEIGPSPVPDGLWVERNFFSASEVQYWGWDLGLRYQFTNDLGAFLNYSGLSETEFVDEESGIGYNLNTPKTRLGIGLDYYPRTGFNANFNLRYQDSFTVINGFYSGEVDSYTLLDLGAGYGLQNGLSFGVSVTNVTGEEFRPMPNLPAIGTMGLLRVKYDF